MFLIEPFIWMFTVKNFKRHFVCLLLMPLVCWIALFFIFSITGCNFFIFPNLFLNILTLIIEIALLISPFLCITGYFWCLTDNIISRDTEPQLNIVYNGKNAALVNVIELPDWDLNRFIWRGIASVFATLIMYIPFTLLMIFIVFNLSTIAAFWNLNQNQVVIAIGIIVFFCATLIPGLLWNYARRDSVIAVLNIPKAIYLMETYPKKYLLNSFLIVVFSLFRSYITRAIVFSLGFGAVLINMRVPNNLSDFLMSESFIAYALIIIIGYVIDSYWIFVNAYLLGTIAPPSEG